MAAQYKAATGRPPSIHNRMSRKEQPPFTGKRAYHRQPPARPITIVKYQGASTMALDIGCEQNFQPASGTVMRIMGYVLGMIPLLFLSACSVVGTAASVTGTVVGTAVDVTASAVSTTADVVTSPVRD